MNVLHQVDPERCRGDGICVEVCPKDALELHDGKARSVTARAEHCVFCGQCVAVCPNEALQLDSPIGETYQRRQQWSFEHPDLLAFLHARRAVRSFAERPVDRALIDQVLEVCASAPPAFPPHNVAVVVLDRRDDIQQLQRALVAGYDRLLGMFNNPIARFMIRRKRGPETFHALQTHVLGIVRDNNQRCRERQVDPYLYDAPVVLLFHADRLAVASQTCANIVATYAWLGAHSVGLGATMLDIVPPILNNLDHELRRSYGIPDGDVVHAALIMGHPKYKYRRVVRRPLKGARYLRDAAS